MTEEKVVVITGCSSGIGLATAVLLDKENNFKVLATMRNLQGKDALEKAAGKALNNTLFIRELDVASEVSIMEFVKATSANEGPIDVLINNAASAQFGYFESVSTQQMQELFQTNVFGTCKLTQEIVKQMKKQESGHIVFISSIGGVLPFSFSDFYVGTKYAIEGIAGSMAPVLRRFNISVTCVEPGPVQTEMFTNASKNNQVTQDDSMIDNKTKALYSTFKASCTALKLQTPQEVAEVIKECIVMENPPFRIQTSEDIEIRARVVLADHTGAKANDLLGKMLGAE